MNYGVKEKEILVLSPYQAQRKHMRDKLNASKLRNVKCKTVKSCEGTIEIHKLLCLCVCMYVTKYIVHRYLCMYII